MVGCYTDQKTNKYKKQIVKVNEQIEIKYN